MLETDIQVKTTHYDGPLSLLLHLVQKQEMDIKELNITLITDQYLAYLNRMQELNFDIAGDYLFMAATLLFLKSRACIDDGNLVESETSSEETGGLQITSRSELIRRLEELEKFQKLGKVLWSRPKLGHETFTRPSGSRRTILNSLLMPMDLSNLALAMASIIGREKSKLTLKRDILSVKDKLVFLREFLELGKTVPFKDIVEKDERSLQYGIQNIVVSFTSLLELARLKKVRLFQSEHFQEIYVELIASIKDFDINLIDSEESATNTTPGDNNEPGKNNENLVNPSLDNNNSLINDEIMNNSSDSIEGEDLHKRIIAKESVGEEIRYDQ